MRRRLPHRRKADDRAIGFHETFPGGAYNHLRRLQITSVEIADIVDGAVRGKTWRRFPNAAPTNRVYVLNARGQKVFHSPSNPEWTDIHRLIIDAAERSKSKVELEWRISKIYRRAGVRLDSYAIGE